MDFNYKYYQENSDQSNELLEYTMYGGKYDIKLVDNNSEGCKSHEGTYDSKTIESFETSESNDSPEIESLRKTPSEIFVPPLYEGILEAYNKISFNPTGVFRKLHQLAASPPEIMRKLPISGEMSSNVGIKKYSIGIVQAYIIIKNNVTENSPLEKNLAPPPFKTESLQPIAFQLDDTMNNGVKTIVTNTYTAFKDKKIGMEAASYGTGLIIAYQNNLTTYSRNFFKPYEISKYYSKELIPEYVFEISYGLTNVYNIYKIILNNNMARDYDFIYNYLLETQKRGINQILSYPMSASYVIGIFTAYMHKDFEELDMDSIKQIQNLYLNNDLIKEMSLNIALSIHKLIEIFQQNKTFALLCTGIPNWN